MGLKLPMLYHDHAHNLVGCTSCSDALACNAKTYKQIYLSTVGKGLKYIIAYTFKTHKMPILKHVVFIFKHKICISENTQSGYFKTCCVYIKTLNMYLQKTI